MLRVMALGMAGSATLADGQAVTELFDLVARLANVRGLPPVAAFFFCHTTSLGLGQASTIRHRPDEIAQLFTEERSSARCHEGILAHAVVGGWREPTVRDSWRAISNPICSAARRALPYAARARRPYLGGRSRPRTRAGCESPRWDSPWVWQHARGRGRL